MACLITQQIATSQLCNSLALLVSNGDSLCLKEGIRYGKIYIQWIEERCCMTFAVACYHEHVNVGTTPATTVKF
jgi:hypothetical protein